MSTTTPSAMPALFDAGTTVKFTAAWNDYPAPTWTAKLYLAGASVAPAVTATASGTAFAFVIPAATTASLTAGNYVWQVLVTSAGETYVADKGTVGVRPSIAAATAGSMLSQAARDLLVVVAAIEGRLTADIEQYSIMGREVRKIPMDQLLRHRGSLEARVQQERAGGKLLDVPVSFNGRS